MGIIFSLPVSHASDNLLNQYKKKKAPAKKEEKEVKEEDKGNK